METISLKLEEGFAKQVELVIKKNNYSTKTEFIREAMREKIETLEKEELIKEFLKFRGKAKKHVSDEELIKNKWKVSEEIKKELDRKFGL